MNRAGAGHKVSDNIFHVPVKSESNGSRHFRTSTVIDGFVVLPCFMTDAISNIYYHIILINSGNRTEWSPIRSIIIRVKTKSDDRAAGVRFVYHEYDYRPNWTPLSPITD